MTTVEMQDFQEYPGFVEFLGLLEIVDCGCLRLLTSSLYQLKQHPNPCDIPR